MEADKDPDLKLRVSAFYVNKKLHILLQHVLLIIDVNAVAFLGKGEIRYNFVSERIVDIVAIVKFKMYFSVGDRIR